MCCREVFPGEFGQLFQFEVGRSGSGPRVPPSMWEAGCGTPTRGLGVVSSEPACLIAVLPGFLSSSSLELSVFVRWRQILNL